MTRPDRVQKDLMMAQTPPGWHAEDIKAGLRKKYGTIKSLAESWGYHRTAITHTLARARYSRPVERLIAQALDVPLCVLWPDRWDREGNSLSRIDAATTTTTASQPQRQKRAAA